MWKSGGSTSMTTLSASLQRQQAGCTQHGRPHAPLLLVCRTMTLKGVRRLLEQDMGLGQKALDAYKSVVGKYVDQVGTPPPHTHTPHSPPPQTAV
jgi:hypothetical protein